MEKEYAWKRLNKYIFMLYNPILGYLQYAELVIFFSRIFKI